MTEEIKKPTVLTSNISTGEKFVEIDGKLVLVGVKECGVSATIPGLQKEYDKMHDRFSDGYEP